MKQILARWKITKNGAEVFAQLTYEQPAKFCLEAQLTYQKIIQVFDGDLCAEINENGGITFSGKAWLGPETRRIATGEGNVTFNVYFDSGDPYVTIESYTFEACGSNGRRLQCKKINGVDVQNEDDIHEILLLQSIVSDNSDTSDFQHELSRLRNIISISK